MIVWGALGLLVRIAFMPISLHTDLLFIYGVPSLLTFHNVWDVFSYLGNTFVDRGFSYYPPLAYFVIAFFQGIFRFIDIGYAGWIGNVFNSMYVDNLEIFYPAILAAKNVPIYLTLMKLPYLLLDIGCGIILFKYFQDSGKALRAFKLWAISPVLIFSSHIFGQFSIVSTFLLLLAVYLVKKKKLELAMFLVGCGIMLEFYPIMFLPAFILIPDVTLKKRLKLIFISLIPFFLIFVPLYITSNGYVKYAFFSKTLQRVMWAQGLTKHAIVIMVAKAFFVVSYIVLLTSLLARTLKRRFVRDSKIAITCAFYAVIIMLLFLSTGYSPVHYLEWITPLLIILVVENVIPVSLYIIQIALLFLFNLDSRQLNMMLFMPINPEYFSKLPSLHEMMNRYCYWGHVISAARLLYSGVSIFIAYRILVISNGLFQNEGRKNA